MFLATLHSTYRAIQSPRYPVLISLQPAQATALKTVGWLVCNNGRCLCCMRAASTKLVVRFAVPLMLSGCATKKLLFVCPKNCFHLATFSYDIVMKIMLLSLCRVRAQSGRFLGQQMSSFIPIIERERSVALY